MRPGHEIQRAQREEGTAGKTAADRAGEIREGGSNRTPKERAAELGWGEPDTRKCALGSSFSSSSPSLTCHAVSQTQDPMHAQHLLSYTPISRNFYNSCFTYLQVALVIPNARVCLYVSKLYPDVYPKLGLCFHL